MKVKLAQLHQPIDASGFPSKMTLSEGTDVVKLEFEPLGLYVTTKNGKVRVIPAANVKYVEIAEDGSQS